jgi:ABC-2 type transport system permease protein
MTHGEVPHSDRSYRQDLGVPQLEPGSRGDQPQVSLAPPSEFREALEGSREPRLNSLRRVVSPSALFTVVRITVARQSRGGRLLVVALLFSLPIVMAILIRQFQTPYRAAEAEQVSIYGLIFQVLIPLTTLIFAAGMVQDEVEEQTLTYLLVRPVPRWLIYLCKLAATFMVALVRGVIFTTATLVLIYWDEPALWTTVIPGRVLLTAALLALSILAYVTIFGALSLWVKRTLAVGAIYIVLFEGVLANIDFVFRYATVMFFIRVLSVRWLDLPGEDWSINLTVVPEASTCLITLLSTSAVFAILGAVTFSLREFRVKTPEGG